MDNIISKLKPYAPVFLRLGLAIVFLLFGFQKLSSPEQTRAEIQLLLDVGIGSAAALNYYVGLFELLVGLSFLIGWFTKYSAPLAALSLCGILASFFWKYGISMDPNLYRDLGLLGGSLAVWFWGAGPWSLEDRLNQPPAEAAKTA